MITSSVEEAKEVFYTLRESHQVWEVRPPGIAILPTRAGHLQFLDSRGETGEGPNNEADSCKSDSSLNYCSVENVALDQNSVPEPGEQSSKF